MKELLKQCRLHPWIGFAILSVVGVAWQLWQQSPTTMIVIATRDLSAGRVLTAADLTTAAVDPSLMPVGAVTGADLGTVVGQAVADAIPGGRPLYWQNLSINQELTSDGIPDGKRMIAVAVDNLNDMRRFLAKGDAVDLWWHSRTDSHQSHLLMSGLLLADLPEDPQEATVAFVVSESEAATLLRAQASGALQVLLKRRGRRVANNHQPPSGDGPKDNSADNSVEIIYGTLGSGLEQEYER